MLPRWQGAKANWTLRDVEVQMLGTTAAAASFYMDGSVRWADGRVDSRPRRVTEVWVNENGTWKEAHHHDSVYTANP
jgi:ketosteroid isomerase-like protein